MTDATDIPSHEAQLQAFFDGELDEREAAVIAARLEREPELQQHLAHMGLMRDLVGRSLEMRAMEVPRARFEQIWDEIDRVIDQETRTARSAAQPPASLWARLGAVLRPLRVPLLATAGAAAVALVAINMAGSDADPVNQGPAVASLPEPAPKVAAPRAPAQQGDRVAQTEPAPSVEVLPTPRPAEAEIHDIQFGGKQGRISHTGVSTVLYVEEDETPQKSERSL